MALKALKTIGAIENTDVPQSETEEQEIFIPKTKWLVFCIGENLYSVKETEIETITKEPNLYDFPFAPNFVEGVIYFHNKIYSVINFDNLLNRTNSAADSIFYLILKSENDNFALQVTNIKDFYMIPDENSESESDENTEFFNGYILLNDEKIPSLDINYLNTIIIEKCSNQNS